MKRWISMLLVAIMVIGAVACGNQTKDDKPGGEELVVKGGTGCSGI